VTDASRFVEPVEGSIWLSTGSVTAFPRLEGERAADVVVVGAGIAGLCIAAACRDAGMTVIVLERHGIGEGTTARSTVKASAAHGLRASRIAEAKGDEAATTYLRSQQAGLDRLEALVHRYAVPCDWEHRRHVIYATAEDRWPDLERELDLERSAGLDVSLVDDVGLPFAHAGGLIVERQAQFHPLRLARGLAEGLRIDGVELYEHSAVDRVEHDPTSVHTEQGSVRAEAIVVATHEPITPDGLFFAKQAPERDYCLAGRVRGSAPAEMYLSVDEPTRSIRTVRHDGEDLLIVAGEHHRVGEEPETLARWERLEAWAASHFGGFERRFAWSAQDPTTIDLVPHIGRAGGRDDLFVATGFGRWGFTNAAVAGEVIAALLSGREHPWIALYDADRSHGWRGVRSALGHNLDVARRFVGDRLRTDMTSLGALAPGAGAVVRTDAGNVAVHVDRQGDLHAVSAICTHLGCVVRWEAAANSWACPCHGSRFTPDGEVIEGPATENLAEVEVGESVGRVQEG
jgi:glycine/D-amino acid oxidase-like deaminating enzyme/nitrite reductase/ring-hydroxylating ferredoxin subunit